MVSETRATQPSGRNVLEDLDSRIPTGFYWYLAVLACVGGFLFGYDTSNIGAALGFIPYHLSSFWTGYLVAGASLGAGAGALIAGPLTDHFGRKWPASAGSSSDTTPPTSARRWSSFRTTCPASGRAIWWRAHPWAPVRARSSPGR